MRRSTEAAMNEQLQERLFSLTGKVALITGGGRASASETANLLVDAGASVAVLDRNAEAREAAAEADHREGRPGLALVADVSKADEVKAAFASALDRFGRLDILVNNAALVRRIAGDSRPASRSGAR